MIEKEEDGITYLVPERGEDIRTIREGIASGAILSKPAKRDFHRYQAVKKKAVGRRLKANSLQVDESEKDRIEAGSSKPEAESSKTEAES
jgi:hypothetical protein